MIARRASGINQTFEWMRKNLFNNWRNSIITVVTTAVIGTLGFFFIKFILVDANWNLVALNQRILLIGSYPADSVWRLWVSLFLFVALAGITYGIWGGKLRPFFITLGIVSVIFLTFGLGTNLQIVETAVEGSSGIDRDLVRESGWAPSWLYAFSLGFAQNFGLNWLLTAGVLALLGTTTALSRRYSVNLKQKSVFLQSIGAIWVLFVPVVILLQTGVSINHWESIFLDILVFVVGCVFSFIIGVLLAVGRISPFFAIRRAAVIYIEVIRAAPLLVWLLLATFLKDEFGPIGEAFSNIDLVFRVMIVFSFFGAAYIAEVIRGGLQSIPRGQFEAGLSIGLSAWQRYVFIILPQAIRAVIPALVGRFIALWKDTALLAALSLINTLEIAKKVLGSQTDIAEGSFFEIYIVVALIYWLVSYALSKLGANVENKFGIGEKR